MFRRALEPAVSNQGFVGNKFSPCEKLIFNLVYRLQRRVRLRVAVTAEILLGQGRRRLHRLADEHVLRLWIRVSRKHGTFGGNTAHRQVKYIQFSSDLWRWSITLTKGRIFLEIGRQLFDRHGSNSLLREIFQHGGNEFLAATNCMKFKFKSN